MGSGLPATCTMLQRRGEPSLWPGLVNALGQAAPRSLRRVVDLRYFGQTLPSLEVFGSSGLPQPLLRLN